MAKKIHISITKARTSLVVLWFGFLVVNLAIVFYLYLDQWIERDNFMASLEQLNAAYAPYLGAITLFYWGSRKKAKATRRNQAGMPLYLALFCSLLWNGIMLIFLIPPFLGTGGIEVAMENIKDVGALLSWLVAGAVGYYFAAIATEPET